MDGRCPSPCRRPRDGIRPATARPRRWLQGDADQDRLGVQPDAEAPLTPSRTCRASASRSAVVPPRLVSASVCLDEIAAPPRGSAKPLPNPAFSISQAADSLVAGTAPDSAGSRTSAPSRPVMAACAAASASSSSSGLVKNEPTLRVSGSPGPAPCPCRARSDSTASRTAAGGAPCPARRPRVRGQLAVADRVVGPGAAASGPTARPASASPAARCSGSPGRGRRRSVSAGSGCVRS